MPVCIYNNTKGDRDAKIRESFDEPSWNNPVVRIIDPQRNDLTPRIHDDWTVAAVATGMVRALAKVEREAPQWLQLLAAEEASRARGVDTAIFGMT